MNTPPEPAATRRVWDLPLRVMHWTLVLAVLGSWMTQELEGDWFRYHLWCGYTVLVVVATRIVWGFVGTRHARFANFIRGPRAVLAYVRALRGPHSGRAGHNPLGALLILAFLVMLLTQATLGLFANDQIIHTGPLFGYVLGSTSDRLTTWHKELFDVIAVAIAIHVLAALGHWRFKRDNLILPMITGRKPAAAVRPEEEIATSRSWLALLILIALAITLALVVRGAPPADLFSF